MPNFFHPKVLRAKFAAMEVANLRLLLKVAKRCGFRRLKVSDALRVGTIDRKKDLMGQPLPDTRRKQEWDERGNRRIEQI